MERSGRLRLGITGGIGSGKTSVCRVFGILGIPVFSADPVANEVMERNEAIKEQLNKLAGKDLYENGKLKRSELAFLIFNNESLLSRINSLVHPAVFELFSSWVDKQDAAYVIMEAAILFESGAFRHVDRILTVIAPLEERISRVISRSRLTRDQVLERVKNQLGDDEKIKRSDFVIDNSEDRMIIPRVLEIHNEILKTLV